MQKVLQPPPFLYEERKKYNKDLLELIKSIKQGDEVAKEKFSESLMTYYKKRCRALYKTLEEVEEASCVVIHRLISKIDMFDLTKAPIPFVYRAMKNHSIDEFRKKSKRTSIEAAAAKTKSYVSYLGEGTDHLINMYKDDLLKGVEKDIFTDTYQTRLSEKEICVKYKLSMTKYKKTINKIKQKFQKEIYA